MMRGSGLRTAAASDMLDILGALSSVPSYSLRIVLAAEVTASQIGSLPHLPRSFVLGRCLIGQIRPSGRAAKV